MTGTALQFSTAVSGMKELELLVSFSVDMFAFYSSFFSLAMEGTCEPSGWVVALTVVAALFVVVLCFCSVFCCWRRVARVRRGLLDEY